MRKTKTTENQAHEYSSHAVIARSDLAQQARPGPRPVAREISSHGTGWLEATYGLSTDDITTKPEWKAGENEKTQQLSLHTHLPL